MALNDVVLIQSLLEKSGAQFGNDKSESEIFELFSFDQILKDYEPSVEELETGWTDGGNDGGIDGYFVFVDNRIAIPESYLYASKKSPKVDVHIFSVRKSQTFEQQPIDTLISSLGELLDLRIDKAKLKYPYNDYVIQQRQLFYKVYVSLAERQPKLNIFVHYCTLGETSQVAPNLKSRAETLHGLLKELFSNVQIDIVFVGATELLELARKQRDFTLRLPYIEILSREGKNYVLLCTLSSYYRFITDEQGKLRRYLFESNIRDYLGEVLINQDIQKTLAQVKRSIRPDFWWLNNGITILGTQASIAGKELCIENVQIVNGLQTTETIYHYFSENKNDRDERAILVKVILATGDETRARIIKATNYQNTVDLSALRGLDKIQHDIEDFFIDHGWFYDRRKNFYKNLGKPAERIVSVSYLASAVRAIALGDPVKSQKQRARSLRVDANYHQVFDSRWDLRVFLASLQITRAVELALRMRRNVCDSPPIAIVHYIGYVYTCKFLNKIQYDPKEVAGLVGHQPSESEVHEIHHKLKQASERSHVPGKSYRGIKLNRAFIERFVSEMFL